MAYTESLQVLDMSPELKNHISDNLEKVRGKKRKGKEEEGERRGREGDSSLSSKLKLSPFIFLKFFFFISLFLKKLSFLYSPCDEYTPPDMIERMQNTFPSCLFPLLDFPLLFSPFLTSFSNHNITHTKNIPKNIKKYQKIPKIVDIQLTDDTVLHAFVLKKRDEGVVVDYVCGEN